MNRDDIRLLLFRLETEIYGVPVEDVSAVVRSDRMNWPPKSGAGKSIAQNNRSIPILDIRAGLKSLDGKTMILLHVHRFQAALVADEVIREDSVPRNAVKRSTTGLFTVWKIGEQEGSVETSS